MNENAPKVDLDELENTVMMLDDADDIEAWVCRQTGKIYVRADLVDPEEEELPDDIDRSDQYIELPTSRDLDLGQSLVFRFVEAEMPQEYDNVRQFFRKQGAYRRFSNLLDAKGLIDKWHRFQDEQSKAALREWCEGHGLQA